MHLAVPNGREKTRGRRGPVTTPRVLRVARRRAAFPATAAARPGPSGPPVTTAARSGPVTNPAAPSAACRRAGRPRRRAASDPRLPPARRPVVSASPRKAGVR